MNEPKTITEPKRSLIKFDGKRLNILVELGEEPLFNLEVNETGVVVIEDAGCVCSAEVEKLQDGVFQINLERL